MVSDDLPFRMREGRRGFRGVFLFMRRHRIALAGVVALVGLAVWWLSAGRSRPEVAVSVPPDAADAAVPSALRERTGAHVEGRLTDLSDDAPGGVEDEEREDEPSEAEKIANAEEERVGAFEVLTDKWTNPSQTEVSMKDVECFVETFRAVPEDRQIECAQRALNLIPDENIVLLTGLLLDKRVSGEVIELIFSDILTRDDDVKLPILRQVRRDVSHPCWEDSNWMLE